MQQRSHRHFLSHTLEHLVAVFAVLAIAVGMGLVGKSLGTPSGGMLAQTSGETWVNLTATTTNASALPIEVSFSAQPGPEARCDTGSPLTPVFFLVTKAAGGEFVISSDTGMNNARLDWGEYFFPNGKYSWDASVKTGFIGMGELHGEFVINNLCALLPASVSVVSSGSVSSSVSHLPIAASTTGVSVPAPPQAERVVATQAASRPQLRLFVDNKPKPTGAVFDAELLELRVTTTAGEKVFVSAINESGDIGVLGYAEKDDLLSKDGVDVWTYEYDMGRSPGGVYKIFATAVGMNKKEILSERMSVEVRHVVAAMKDNIGLATPTYSGGALSTSVRVSPEEKRAIIDRVSDPASCTNEEECHIYCNNLPNVNNQCITYVRHSRATLFSGGQSLLDGVDSARIALLLGDTDRRSKDIPELIRSPEEFRQYCADMAHAEVCTKALVRNDMGRSDALLAMKASITRSREEEMKIFTERVGARVFIDSDGDGVTDYDEVNIYGTDPDRVDTDGDGFPDGAELLARTNPRGGERLLVATSSVGSSVDALEIFSDESVRHENPIIAGILESTLLTVRDVIVAELGTSESGSTTIKKLKIEGLAPANSFVTVYIFSDPIVVTVKADARGAWAYILDKNLLDGTHHVYGAITDVGGRIIAKSEPLAFLKESAAVSVSGVPAESGVTDIRSWRGASLYAMIAVVIGVLGFSFSIIGFIMKRKKGSDMNLADI